MRRKLITLKSTADSWQYIVALNDAGKVRLLTSGTILRESELPDAELFEKICGGLQLGDRVAVSLPATAALFRWLEFPFQEPRKLAAATPPELARLLPESDNRLVRHQLLNEGRVLGIAVGRSDLEKLLEQFDDEIAPLGYIGLAPLCYIEALDWPADSLFICRDGADLILGRVENSRLNALRLLPKTPITAGREVIRQLQLLGRAQGAPLLRVRLLGIDREEPLTEQMITAGFEVDPVHVDTEEGPVSADLIPLACLAQTATSANPLGINLRSGSYKLKGEWQALKKRLWLAGGLLLLGLGLFATSAGLQIAQHHRELDRLREQLEARYSQAFPGEKRLAPPRLQLESKLRALQQKADQIGIGSITGLETLELVSATIPADLKVDIREYLFSPDGLRLSGSTDSFDTVSRLLATLQKEESFSEVRMLDSKQTLDGNQVDFQLQLRLRKEGA